jgi:hypothetical protein
VKISPGFFITIIFTQQCGHISEKINTLKNSLKKELLADNHHGYAQELITSFIPNRVFD